MQKVFSAFFYFIMVLIISQRHYEHTTNKVIDWIDYYDHKFKRINGIDVYKKFNLIFDNEKIKINMFDIEWGNIGCVWFRRWISIYDKDEIFLRKKYDSKDKNDLVTTLNRSIREEYRAITKFFLNSISDDICFNKIFDEEINKLTVLKKAHDLGLKIPSTIVSTNADKINKSDKFIVKPISNVSEMRFKNESYLGYTTILDKAHPFSGNYIAPSLIQENIKKKYEIRAFYMDEFFYSMAIFSQNDDITKLDFRNYNKSKPNRNVPYNLPVSLEKKLKEIALFFKLNTCSFDIIYSESNEYYFLEVNPGGQFGMVSYPCNYYLEEKLAKLLIKNDKLKNEKRKNNT